MKTTFQMSKYDFRWHEKWRCLLLVCLHLKVAVCTTAYVYIYGRGLSILSYWVHPERSSLGSFSNSILQRSPQASGEISHRLAPSEGEIWSMIHSRHWSFPVNSQYRREGAVADTQDQITHTGRAVVWFHVDSFWFKSLEVESDILRTEARNCLVNENHHEQQTRAEKENNQWHGLPPPPPPTQKKPRRKVKHFTAQFDEEQVLGFWGRITLNYPENLN